MNKLGNKSQSQNTKVTKTKLKYNKGMYAHVPFPIYELFRKVEI